MLKTTLKILPAAILLAACAQTQEKLADLNIQPFQEIRHSYDQALALYQMGRYYQGQLRYRQAEAAYRKSLEVEPGMVDAWNALGTVYAETGDLPRARSMFEQALKHDPQSGYTYNNLGYVHYLEGNNEAATEAFKHALRLEGSSVKARQNLVLVYSRMGMKDQIASTGATSSVEERPSETQSTSLQEKSTEPTAVAEVPTAKWVQVSSSIYEAQLQPTIKQPDTVSPAEKPQSANSLIAASVEPVKPAVQNMVSVTAPTTAEAKLPAIAASQPPRQPEPALKLSYTQLPMQQAVVMRTSASAGGIPDLTLGRWGTEVSNGNGIRGFAARMAHYFSGFGITKARLTNQKPFVETHTRIEYRPGSEGEAVQLNALLPKAVPHVASNSLRSDIRVRLVLGHDLRRDITVWENYLNGDTKVAIAPEGLKLPQI